MRYIVCLVSLFLSLITIAQTSNLEKIRSYREKNEPAIYNDFISFLKIPNVATDTANLRKNADFLTQLMNSKGIERVQLLEADSKNIPPVVYGEMNVSGATKTIIFYAHYDGQPVNSSLWAKGLNPFQPQLVNGRIEENASIQASANFPLGNDWRIYARGASDDKAGVIAILTAFSAIKES